MTPRCGPTRDSSDDWTEYLARADEFLESAQEMLATSDGDSRAKVVASNAMHAAIAFGDALTVAKLGVTNRQDHNRLPKLVAEAAGKSADDAQIARLGRILSRKDQADYGARPWRRDDAEKLTTDVERFAAWIRTLLR